MPSPILPDGRLVPLPIPSDHDRASLGELNFQDLDLAWLLADLSKGSYSLDTTVHLDPDLDKPFNTRPLGWRPTLGQTGAAQGHLASMGVEHGDVFLFFGWFREVEKVGGRWKYARNAPNLHVIYGWIEVEAVLPIVKDRKRCLQEFPWIADHPHVANPGHYTDPLNTLYVAKERSCFSPHAQFGGGRFSEYSEALQLTMPGYSRSVWALPSWFMPIDTRPPLSYHPNPSRWKLEETQVRLQSAAKGQEFVLCGDHYPELEGWLARIIGEHA